jgi:signal transduction histidine kinase
VTPEATRVLVVDDNDAARFIKVQILRRAGYQVSEVSTGAEGLAFARDHRPDLVVLDVNLPDMSGLEVCRRIKNELGTPSIQVLQVSQTAVTEADRARGLDEGADMYLIEPFGPPVLLATVRALMRAKRAEAELEQALEREKAARTEAERANRMKDEFVAMVSHELRTPLNAMTGSIWQLKRGTTSREGYERAVDVLERNARVQVQLINDLLDVSRISAGKLDVQRQPLDVGPVVEAAAVAAAAAPEHKRKMIKLEVHAEPAVVLGDPARLEQVISNVLNNAFQFTPLGGTITVECGVADDRVFIRVRDNGAGIDPQFLPHVFERFRQERPLARGRERGLGLGLAIVQYLVEQHEGTIALESEGVGRGTTCTITMPLLGARSLNQNVAGELSASSLAGLRVLVVEDDPDAREVLGAMLVAYGATVRVLESGQTALERMERETFDVVVTDIGLPEFDGIELLRRIRAAHHTLPAIAVTAFATEDDRRRILTHGFAAHVAKPIELEQLVPAVASAAGRSSSAKRESTSGRISSEAPSQAIPSTGQ